MTATDLRQSRQTIFVLYALLALAVPMQATYITMIMAIPMLFCVVAYAYILRHELAGTYLAGHARWMIRSFWLGLAVYLPLAVFLLTAVVLVRADYNLVGNAMLEDERNPAHLARMFVENNYALITRASAITITPFFVWWLYRAGTGVYYALRARDVPRVMRWL